MRFLSDILIEAGLIVDGTVQINTIANALTDTDRFIVSDSGVVKYRTGAQVASDIDAMTKAVYDTDGDGIVDNAEKVTVIARNSTGSTIYKGTIVYLSGSTGNRPNMLKAQANSEATSSKTFGVVIEDVADNSDGEVAALGTLHDLDTRSGAPNPFTSDTLVDGDVLWLSPTTAGYVTRTKPTAPNHAVFIGIVARTSPTNGRIVYRIQNGFELEELHNVSALTPANNDGIFYNSSTGLWEAKSIATAAGGTIGTVTSVAMTVPTGLQIGGSPITSSGTLALTYASGYAIPTTVKQSNWDDAYTWVSAFPTQTGNSGKYLTTDGNTLSWATVTAGISGSGTSGQVAYWTGTSSQSGSSTFLFSPTTELDLSQSVTASSAIARGIRLRPTLTAAANNDVLVGLDIAPTYTVGAFTGIVRYGLRFTGTMYQTIPTGASQSRVLAHGSTANIITESFDGNNLSLLNNTGNNALILGNNGRSYFNASGTPSLLVYSTGNVAIQNGGTFTDGGQRLQVTGDAIIVGSGTTSSTRALYVRNSTPTDIFTVRNDGAVVYGGASVGIYTSTDRGQTINTGAGALFIGYFAGGDLAYASAPAVTIGRPSNRLLNGTSGTQTMGSVVGNYSPTSGTGLFTTFEVIPTINQTGGANGITRGLYVNPTLTAAADWRSIEWSNSTGWGLYGAGTANNYLAGSLGIGSTSLTGYNLRMSKAITGATTSYGISINSSILSGVTGDAVIYHSFPSTQAASFTTYVNHFYAQSAFNGAGSTIEEEFGFRAVVGTYSNRAYGFYGSVASGTNKWNLYMNGTANNYLAGKLGLGTTDLTSSSFRVRVAITGSTLRYNIVTDGVIQSDVTNAARYFSSISQTQAASFSIGSIFHYTAEQGTIGAGSSISEQNGFYVYSSMTGATNNFGFRGDIASGTGRWNLYMSGTAANYMNGNLLLGSTTDGGQKLQVTGNAIVTGDLTVTKSGTTTFTFAGAGAFQYDVVSTASQLLYTSTSGTFRTKFAGNNSGMIVGATAGTQTSGVTLLIATIANRGNNVIESSVGPQFHSTNQTLSTISLSATVSFDPTNNTTGSIHSGIRIGETFAPNTANKDIQYIGLNIASTINQSIATQITRGLYINPTLTAAADWRSIEWSNNSGWGLYGAGSGNNYLQGNLTIGSTTITAGYAIRATGGIYATGNLRFDGGVRDNRDNTIISQSASGVTSNRVLTIANATYLSLVVDNANLLLGSAVDGGQKLQVTGQAIISSTSSRQLVVSYPGGAEMRLTASATANNFSILDVNGYGLTHGTSWSGINASQTNIRMWTQATNTLIFSLGGQDLNPTVARTRTIIEPVTSSSTLFSPTSGNAIDYVFRTIGNSRFSPTSGNATYTFMSIVPEYNTTGTYSGTVTGFIYNPTLTSLTGATHRAIQTVSGDVLFGTTSGSVGVGTSTINASAILELSSTTKGFLPPRMTGTEAEAIASPAAGLLVYITNGNGTTITSTGWWGYESSGWIKIN